MLLLIHFFTLGTGFSLGAAGQATLLEQIAFLITGTSPTNVQLISWHTGYQYVHATLNLGFDASAVFLFYFVVEWERDCGIPTNVHLISPARPLSTFTSLSFSGTPF